MPHDAGDHTSRLFTILSHRYRRIILYYLKEHETASIDRLTDLITGWIEAGPGGDDELDDEETLRLKLHHVHIPALVKVAYVSYDRETEEVAIDELAPVAEEVLDAALRADTTETGVDSDAVFAGVDGNGA